MGIQIISISHKIAPLHVREMFAFTEEQQKHMMQKITEHLEVSECIVLSTCNRTEMYVYSDSESKGCVFNLMEDTLLEEAGAQEEEDIGNYLLFYHGEKAIHHLFQVTAGLDSMVIGEDQILGQVKTAHKQAREAGTTGVYLNTFFRMAVTGAKKVKTETELSKTLAEAMFGSENALIRVDMSEYMEKHAVSKFIGSPPGYVGFEEGGQLTEKIRKHPYSVILFDEIEKAHPDVFNIMLQILDDGILTDAQGRKVDFKNTVIIMTSNLGAKEILGNVSSKLGFKKDEEKDKNISEHDSIKNKVMEEVKRAFKPEFLNRIDDIIVFDRLTEDNIKEIAKLMLKSLEKRLNANEINVTFTESAVSKIAKSGFDPVYGARPLRRAIQNEIEDMLSEEIIDGNIKSGDSITVDVEDDKFTVKK